MVTCQFSLYPLRAAHVEPSLNAALAELRAAGLEPQVGMMSSFVEGELDAVFDGLRRAFKAATDRGDAVLVATVSNACRVEPRLY